MILAVAVQVSLLLSARLPDAVAVLSEAATVAPMILTCTDGAVQSCTLTGCLKAQKICVGGTWDPCTCVITTCDDSNPCTTDTFNGTSCVHSANTGSPCDDGNACTTGDTCTSAGACVGTAAVGASCSDGNLCNGAETCNAAGVCAPGSAPTLDDGNTCTYDYCDATGVHHDTIASGCAPPPNLGEAYSTPIVAPNPTAYAVPRMPTAGGPIVDENTGAVTYDYSFELPPARGRHQPSLGLTYSSASTVNQGFGAGWSLGVPYIEADVSVPPTAASDNRRIRWWISLGGKRSMLLPVPGDSTRFRQEIQGGMVDITYASGIWSATDVVGNRYQFDQRAPNPPVADRGRWYLGSVQDVDGNKTVYEYQNETGAASVLTAVHYNNYVSAGVSYFATNIQLDYAQYYPVRVEPVADTVALRRKVLTAVRIKGPGQAGASILLLPTLLRHELTYERVPQAATLVLRWVTVKAGDTAVALPATEFKYEQLPASYKLDVGGPFLFPTLPGGRWLDLDGDGLVDWVAGLKWQRNLSSPGGAVAFQGAQDIPGSAGLTPTFGGNPVRADLLDMNGDRILDLVTVGASGCDLEVRLGQVVNGQYSLSTQPYCVDASAVKARCGNPVDTGIEFGLRYVKPDGRLALVLQDQNGDGVPDFLVPAPSGLVVETPPAVGYVRGWFFETDADGWGHLRWADHGSATPGPVGTPNGGYLSVYLGYGGPGGQGWGFADPFYYPVPDTYDAMEGGDLNGDTYGDFFSSTLGVQFFGEGRGTAITGSMQWFTTRWVSGFGLESSTAWPGMTAWSPAVASGAFTCPPMNPLLDVAFLGVSAYEDPRQTAAYADLNGDGRPDLVWKPNPGDASCPSATCPVGSGPIGATCPAAACPMVVIWNTGGGHEREAEFLSKAYLANGTLTDMDLYPSVSYKADGGKVTCKYNEDPGSRFAAGSSTFTGWTAGFMDLNGDGIADYVTNQAGEWTLFKGMSQPVRLSAVVTSAGATYAITYGLSPTLGAVPSVGPSSVVTRIAVSGPGIATASTGYLYSLPARGASALDPYRPEARGFEVTWSWLESSGVAQRTQWATASHALTGSPVKVEWGTFTGSTPSDASFVPFRRVELTYQARAPGGTTCTAHTQEPPASSYPGIVPVVTLERTTNILDDGATLVSSRSRACATDVDDLGNILKTRVDPDVAYSGDEHDEVASFDATATCRSCPWESKLLDTSGMLLGRSVYLYDSPLGTWDAPLAEGKAGAGHLNYVRRWAGDTRYDIDAATAYNANGTPASRISDPYPGSHSLRVTESYTYDAQALRVTQTAVTDGNATLYKDVDYDQTYGWPVREYDLYRAGGKGSAAKVEYARDGFGRIVATGRAAARDAATGNITLTGALTATEYVDASPPVVKSYAFLAPLNLTLTAGAVPVRPDVRQVITYRDALGRVSEVKERLGASGTPDASAQIAQVLTGYRVSSHVKRDLAGRVLGSLEPYASSVPDPNNFDVVANAYGQRGSMSTFDVRGRVTCSKVGVYSALAADTTCASSTADTTSYMLGTKFSFRTITSAGRVLAAATAVPPGSTSTLGSETAYRADGLVAFATDPYGNTVTNSFDLLGRPTAVTRQAVGVASSAQTVTRKYDALGRVLEETDDNWSPGAAPSRVYTYDALGRAYDIQLPPQLVGSTTARPKLHTEFRSLGRVTWVQALEPSLQLGAVTFVSRTVANYTYDAPYANSSSYLNTAGRVASIASPLTTIAFGYDQNGRVNRRDQWLANFTGAFSLTGEITDDGRVKSSTFTSPSSYAKAVSYFGGYDSAGRPVKIGLGGTYAAPVMAAWEARNSADSSYDAYDVFGRVGLVKSNGGTVKTSRNYATFTGALTSQVATLNSATRVYGVESVLYLGTKLSAFQDTTVSGTTTSYSNHYDLNGRLTSAAASKVGTANLPQSYSQSYAFGDPSWPLGASMGNLEKVTDGTATDYGYIGDRVVAQTGSASFGYRYDLAGRLAAKMSGTTEKEGFAYDLQDQLKQVRRDGSLSEVLEYDPTGLPLFRKLGTSGTWYVGSAATVTATVSASCTGYANCAPTAGSVRVAPHVLLAGGRIATVKAQTGTGADPISDVLYYHRDLQGSVVATTLRSAGANGVLGAKYRYTPYGQLDRSEGVTAANDSELGYTGGLRLGYTPGVAQQGSLILLGARVYHAELKRWLQADTVDGLRYTYAASDPANLVDPSGRMPALRGNDASEGVMEGLRGYYAGIAMAEGGNYYADSWISRNWGPESYAAMEAAAASWQGYEANGAYVGYQGPDRLDAALKEEVAAILAAGGPYALDWALEALAQGVPVAMQSAERRPILLADGIGFVGSASLEAGLVAVGAGATGSAGAGLFWGGTQGTEGGLFAGGGAFAGGPFYGVSCPARNQGDVVGGAFVGAGLGVFYTNASSAAALSGEFNTYSFNVGIGPYKFSAQLGLSGSTYIFSVTVGPGIGISGSGYVTNTPWVK